MSIFPASFYIDDSTELKALRDSINGSVKVAKERFAEAEDARARIGRCTCDECCGERLQREEDYRLAQEALRVATRLQYRFNGLQIRVFSSEEHLAEVTV